MNYRRSSLAFLLTRVQFTWMELSMLAILAGVLVAGYIGWIVFIVGRSDGERKQLEQALNLDQEQSDRLRGQVEEPKAEFGLQRRVKVGVAVAVLLTSLLGLLSWRMEQQAAEDADWVAQTHELSTTLEAALRHLLDVETAARGFALTGREPFLEPFESGKYAVGLDLQALHTLLTDPYQKLQLRVLEQRANTMLEASNDLVKTRPVSTEIATIVELERGKQFMDAVRETVQGMEAKQKDLLEQRSQRARATRQFTSSAIGLGSIFGIIFLSIAGITVIREIGVSTRARAQIKTLNAELEQRVEQRTAALQSEVAERMRVEEALREKEHLLSESQRIAHVGSWTCDLKDPTGRLVWSDELYRMYGVSPETFTPSIDELLQRIIPEDRSAVAKWMAACAAGEKPGDVQFRLRLPDGTVRVFNRRGELQYDRENRPIRMAGTSQDITERRQVEDALRESEERFQAMVNGIPQLAWMAEADGSIFWYNQRWYEFTGTTLEQMQGWGWQSVHHPDFLPKVIEGWKSAIAAGNPWDMEFPLRGTDGLFRTFLTRVMPLKDSAGHVVRWFGTNTDISERKRTEERLAAQAEELLRSQHALETQKLMLQSVLDSMVEGLVAADEQGKIILWNPAAEKLVGLGSTDLSPKEWSAHYGIFLPDTVTPIPPGQTPLELAIRGEASSSEIFLRNPGLNRDVWLEINGSPLRGKDGVLRGGVTAFRDITRRKADELEIRKLNEDLEERIAKRTEQLEAANRELEAFSYSVSHDLRTPLRHIAGFSRILVNEFGPLMAVEARDHLQHIENAARRMGLLVDALLSMAVLRRQALRLRHCELNPIVDEVISLLRPECEGRDVEWRIAPLPALDCDPILIGQVLQNLLSNALKYSRGRSRAVIEVDSIQQSDKPPVIFVRDNGAGFNMKYAQKLFGMFQRLHTESEFEGTGVGLATVHRIIQKHGGVIWAEAEADHGATFYFALQATEQPEVTARATAFP